MKDHFKYDQEESQGIFKYDESNMFVINQAQKQQIKKQHSFKPDALPQRRNFPIPNPIFGSFEEYIELPEFIDGQYTNEPFIRANQVESQPISLPLTFKKKSSEKLLHFMSNMVVSDKNKRRRQKGGDNQSNYYEVPFENYSQIDFYLNSIIEKIIYSKYPISGKTIQLSNYINLNSSSCFNISKKTEPKSLLDNIFGISKVNADCKMKFESRFESGNLLMAFELSANNYQLVLQNDTNTNGYNQWFFFRVENNSCTKDTVAINIVNMSQKYSLFNEGMRISCYSETKAKVQKIGWHRAGNNIKFYSNGLYKFVDDNRKNFSSLYFNYTFEYSNDVVYFAMNIPFTYTKLTSMLNNYSRDDKKFK